MHHFKLTYVIFLFLYFKFTFQQGKSCNIPCVKHMGKICSGPEHGICECGNCVCFQDWIGEACECSTNTKTCISPNNGQLCSDHGACICGKCHCSEIDGVKFYGNFCEECSICPTHCDDYRDCVECSFQIGKYDQTQCKEKCNKYDIQRKVKIDNYTSKHEIHCRFPVGKCFAVFKYFYDEKDEVKLDVQEAFDCSDYYLSQKQMSWLQKIWSYFG